MSGGALSTRRTTAGHHGKPSIFAHTTAPLSTDSVEAVAALLLELLLELELIAPQGGCRRRPWVPPERPQVRLRVRW